MTLSGRPIPELPATLPELAEAVRERHRQLEGELDDFFAGVDEAAAFSKPGPQEWSAAEILAHLIHSERYTHVWIAELADGHEGWHDDWGGNSDAQVAATVRAYPAVTALLDELKRHHVETAAFVENLPAEFPRPQEQLLAAGLRPAGGAAPSHTPISSRCVRRSPRQQNLPESCHRSPDGKKGRSPSLASGPFVADLFSQWTQPALRTSCSPAVVISYTVTCRPS
jgi:hypothetical protein